MNTGGMENIVCIGIALLILGVYALFDIFGKRR